jgi:hypothetical protein
MENEDKTLDIVINQFKDRNKEAKELEEEIHSYSEENIATKMVKPVIERFHQTIDSVKFPVTTPSFIIKDPDEREYENMPTIYKYEIYIRELVQEKKDLNSKRKWYEVFFVCVEFVLIFFLGLAIYYNFRGSKLILFSVGVWIILGVIGVKCWLKARDLGKRSRNLNTYFWVYVDETGKSLEDMGEGHMLSIDLVKLLEEEITAYFISETGHLDEKILQKALELKQQKTNFCFQCGSESGEKDIFCAQCGVELNR